MSLGTESCTFREFTVKKVSRMPYKSVNPSFAKEGGIDTFYFRVC